MRAVLDTVVFVRALIGPRGLWGRVLFEACDQYTLVLSPEIIREILEVLYRSKLRERFPQIDEVAIDRVLVIFESAEVIEPEGRLSVCRDPKDDKFFECAVEGRTDVIVSEDSDILDVSLPGIRTVTAREFLELLRGE